MALLTEPPGKAKMIYDAGVTQQPLAANVVEPRAFGEIPVHCKWQLAAVRRYSVGPFAAS